MKKYLPVLFMLLLSTGCKTSTSPNETSVTFATPQYAYDIDNSIRVNGKKPFAHLSGDSLIITDYWLMKAKYPISTSTDYNNDTIVISYDTIGTHSSDSTIIIDPNGTDWAPSIEATSKFIIKDLPQTFYVKIKSVPVARKPDSLETSLGFRNAGIPIIKEIMKDSL